jgi:hypothetical protein
MAAFVFERTLLDARGHHQPASTERRDCDEGDLWVYVHGLLPR